MVVKVEHASPLWEDTTVPGRGPADPALLQDLRTLALDRGDLAHGDLAHLAGDLFELLRKHSGGPLAQEILLGVQHLAGAGEPAGARLLGAFLDVATPAGRLLPLVDRFSHARRVMLGSVGNDPHPGLVMADWKERLGVLGVACTPYGGDQDRVDGAAEKPGREAPWGGMRGALAQLSRRIGGPQALTREDRRLLVDLLRLEVDAWQERISRLAGTIDPFRVQAIARVLPLLGRADGQVRDLRHLIGLIETGEDEAAFLRPRSRVYEVMEHRELACLRRTLEDCRDLQPLHELFTWRQEAPIPVPALAHGMARLQALAARLQRAGRRRSDLDPLAAARLVQQGFSQGEVALPCPEDLEPTVREILARPDPAAKGPGSWPLHGVELLVGQLVVVIPELEDLPPPWRHHLPTPDQRDPSLPPVPGHDEKDATGRAASAEQSEQSQDDQQEMTPSAMKNLVMTNLQSTSLLLGFLRNAKFTSVPGLVEDVANRTRSALVIETIASDRTLHTGFANRGVPQACLRSPVNVSVKTLRKFIHVKYVSKVELKRMALDRTGIRQEVGQEIRKYLDNLA